MLDLFDRSARVGFLVDAVVRVVFEERDTPALVLVAREPAAPVLAELDDTACRVGNH